MYVLYSILYIIVHDRQKSHFYQIIKGVCQFRTSIASSWFMFTLRKFGSLLVTRSRFPVFMLIYMKFVTKVFLRLYLSSENDSDVHKSVSAYGLFMRADLFLKDSVWMPTISITYYAAVEEKLMKTQVCGTWEWFWCLQVSFGLRIIHVSQFASETYQYWLL